MRTASFSIVAILALFVSSGLTSGAVFGVQDEGAHDAAGQPEADPHAAEDIDHGLLVGDHAEDDEHGDDGHGEHGGHHDQGMIAAANLAVGEPPSWYGWVVGGIATLFVLAATLGSLAVIARGPEPADPADAHGHDDHDHGHGH
ncbi:MAG: hypothetical protein ACF8PN_14785 [Phycisphaerales bacterium]